MSNVQELAKRYVDLSNEGKWQEAAEMFSEDVVYESSQLGEFRGKAEVREMMRAFFSRFHGIFWAVEQYIVREDQSVFFDFAMTASDPKSGEKVARIGRESLHFNEQSLIEKVHVVAHNQE